MPAFCRLPQYGASQAAGLLLASLPALLPLCQAAVAPLQAQAVQPVQAPKPKQAAQPEAAEHKLSLLLQHPGDSVSAQKLSHSLQLSIKSSKGFGWLEISREPEQAWPEQLLFELRYSYAKPFKQLEMFSLQGDNWRLQGSLHDWKQQRPAALQGAKLEPALAKLQLQIKPLEHSICLLLDCSALANCSKLRLQWVDMLR